MLTQLQSIDRVLLRKEYREKAGEIYGKIT